MNSVGKTLLSIFLVLVVGGIGILIYCSLPAIKGVITNNKYYTHEDVQNSYDSGYKDGCKSETEFVFW